MATWKKVITEDSAAALASLTLTTKLADAQISSAATWNAKATPAQGTKADAALPKTGGAMTGPITTNSTFDTRDVATDGTKLDTIETSATADQTPAQLRTAIGTGNGNLVPALGGSGTFLDNTGAFSTPSYTANVTLTQEQVQDFAGGLMVAAGGTKTGITVTYDDANNNMDFVVANADKLAALDTQATTDTALALLAPIASPTFTGTVAGITKTMVSLGNVANENRATILGGNLTGTVDGTAVATIKSGAAAGATANQDETATIQAGTTAANVGLGSVTNESKGTMFTNPTFTGTAGAAALTTSGNVIIGGTLTVSGATTTVNTETINLADNFINLNSNQAGNAAGTEDAGITVNRGNLADAQLFWDEGVDRWSLSLENLSVEADAATPNAYVQVIQSGTTAAASYAAPLYGGTTALGTMYVKTDDTSGANIYIYA